MTQIAGLSSPKRIRRSAQTLEEFNRGQQAAALQRSKDLILPLLREKAEHGIAEVSLVALGARLGVSNEAARLHIKRLEEHGVLRRIKRSLRAVSIFIIAEDAA